MRRGGAEAPLPRVTQSSPEFPRKTGLAHEPCLGDAATGRGASCQRPQAWRGGRPAHDGAHRRALVPATNFQRYGGVERDDAVGGKRANRTTPRPRQVGLKLTRLVAGPDSPDGLGFAGAGSSGERVAGGGKGARKTGARACSRPVNGLLELLAGALLATSCKRHQVLYACSFQRILA